MYDSKSGGFTEGQTTAGKRILDETPLLKGNPNITGVETNLRKFEVSKATGENRRVQTLDDHINYFPHPVGTSDYKTDSKPTTKVQLYRGALISSRVTASYSSNNIASAMIAQIPIKIYFSSSILHHESEEAIPTTGNSFQSAKFADGTYFNVEFENPIIRLSENSGFDEKENYSLTAYKVHVDPNTNMSTFHKLKMPPMRKKIVNNLLISEDEGYGDFDFEVENYSDGIDSVVDDTHLSYYIDILYDKQISQSEICNAIGELKIKNIFLDERIDCPDDIDDGMEMDIYGSRVTPEDLEDC